MQPICKCFRKNLLVGRKQSDGPPILELGVITLLENIEKFLHAVVTQR